VPRHLVLTLAAALLAAAPLAAAAEEDPATAPSSEENAETMRAAQRAYDELTYDKALSLLAELETKTNLKPWEKVTVLKFRAFIHINTENEIFARDAIVSIYHIDPAFVLPDSEPPKIQKVFAEVKREFVPKKKKKKDLPAPVAKAIVTGDTPTEPAGGAAVGKQVAAAERPNLLVRFWPSWAGLATGVALLTPGVVLGATATADRAKLTDAPRDEAGRIVGITKAEAEAMQDDASSKALIGNVLMGAGAAVAVTGAVLFLFYDDGWHGWRGFQFSLAPTRDGASVGALLDW
jgi:hypothetical protein